jgi:hypothetical protein
MFGIVIRRRRDSIKHLRRRKSPGTTRNTNKANPHFSTARVLENAQKKGVPQREKKRSPRRD